MSTRTIPMTDALYDYFLGVSLREPAVLARLRDATLAHPEASMQISPEQGQFMRFLIRLMGAKRAIEIGTFTGYSALSVALAMPDDGYLVACERREEFTKIGQPFWREAGVADRIDLRIGKAVGTLEAMLEAGEGGTYDFAFIDGDKKNYVNYYDLCLQLVRIGGVIAIDNALWSGRLTDETLDDPATTAIRTLNESIRDDDRVDMSLLPIGDGLMLARRIA
ncbi:MAG: class I SAM-dependent methyltransferase [Rhodospirillaceae bacterium]|nr:class I SAM-dependent methyltransferase [Rhodospirillaceae bacterium]MDD9917607.1 class I SAM-dependent methyltransferase [Rhodospirillaceae bacterium]